jgi:hypothetical protein
MHLRLKKTTNLGDSSRGIVLMCNFCISSIVPIVKVLSFAIAKLEI